MSKPLKYIFSVIALLGLSFACYLRPIPDDFDRYIYEAIVRSKTQQIEQVYEIVKHENPRAEGSSVLDSPQHLRELEPLYAIRPLYVEAISLVSTVLPVQRAINFISAASLFGIGIIVVVWTKKPILSALLMSSYSVLLLGRGGVPDGLAALLAICALWLIQARNRMLPALCFLFICLGVRTDSILLLWFVLGWLAWEKKIAIYKAVALAALAFAIVVAIHHWAGNYGWIVLFRYSFIGGRYPAQEAHTLTVREYLRPFLTGASVILTRVSIWVLMGILAYKRRPTRLLLVVAFAAASHFLLFPSAEDRYLIWAYIIAAIALMEALGEAPQPKDRLDKAIQFSPQRIT